MNKRPAIKSSRASQRLHALLAQGLELHRKGNLPAAERAYREILSRHPRHFDALHFLGVARAQSGDAATAASLIASAVLIKPDSAEAHNNLGNALAALQRFQEAADCYEKALKLRPEYADALNNLGNALKSMRRCEHAITCYARALALAPDYPEAHNNMGEALKDLARNEEAMGCFRKAIALRPGYAEAHNNIGVLLQAENKPEEACVYYRKALALNPGSADAHNNLGFALQSLNRVEEALDHYRRASSLKPEAADVVWNESLALLCLGNFRAGWEKYEWRWKQKLAAGAPDFDRPLWLGQEPIEGKKILLCSEQGAGDSLQCLRYLSPLSALRPQHMYLRAGAELAELAARSFSFVSVIKQPALPAEFDLYCPLMSLPLALKTFSEADIPGEVPYVAADAGKRRKWRARIRRNGKPLVGLAWRGNPQHKNDHNRSIPFNTATALLQSEDAHFVIIQVPLSREEKQFLEAKKNCTLASDELTDFDETAAILAEMDLVITVDTSIAHLAGALGRDVWILLPFAPDWRWLLHRPDSPWYPTARLFRQARIGDWNPVLDSVRQSLRLVRAQSHQA